MEGKALWGNVSYMKLTTHNYLWILIVYWTLAVISWHLKQLSTAMSSHRIMSYSPVRHQLRLHNRWKVELSLTRKEEWVVASVCLCVQSYEFICTKQGPKWLASDPMRNCWLPGCAISDSVCVLLGNKCIIGRVGVRPPSHTAGAPLYPLYICLVWQCLLFGLRGLPHYGQT